MEPMAELFDLIRDEDATGISGTGHVAWGVRFPDGVCVLRWCSEFRSTAVYASMEELVAIHGHDGKTRVEWWHFGDDAAEGRR